MTRMLFRWLATMTLLSLILVGCGGDDDPSAEEAKAALQESVLRVGSIALVHETLSAETSDLAEFGDVARRVVLMVGDALGLPERQIEIKVAGGTGPLGADVSTPLAVTLVELLQNCVDHAFPDGRPGTVGVELSATPDEVAEQVAAHFFHHRFGALRHHLRILAVLDHQQGHIHFAGQDRCIAHAHDRW